MSDTERQPQGELAIRVLAMPADTNPAGDIFGGWVLSQMDIAGGTVSNREANGRCVTIAIDSMTFHKPVLVGDTLCCYVRVIKKGNTSITVHIESWAKRQYEEETRVLVTEGIFTYVAVTSKRVPRKLDSEYS
jgi:acyl-CoA thioesterase YciA